MIKDPSKFKGEFTFHYIEDENGDQPKRYEGFRTVIPLECLVEEGTVKLFGEISPYKIKCYDLKYNNHNYGMYFAVKCRNKDENFSNKVLWRRAVDKNFLHEFFRDLSEDTTMNLEGDIPEVPNCPASTIKINLVKDRRDYHTVDVSLEMSLDIYDLFISRYSD